MADKKRQHFVPRFYLKNFSNDSKTLTLFNIKESRFIRDISLKDQCAEKYFYGKDLMVENGLEEIETEAPSILSQIINNDFIPKAFSHEHYSLMTFIVTLEGRTKFSAESNSEMIEALWHNIVSDHPDLTDQDRERYEIGSENPVIMPLMISLANVPISLDLGIHIYNNPTKHKLITSDNPVVQYNKYCEEITNFSNRGLASSGLLIFFTLTPNKVILFYDTNIYKIGLDSKNHSDLTEKDVFELNKLQYINALNNIYYRNPQEESQIEEIDKLLKDKRHQSKVSLAEYEIKHSEDTILHVKKPSLNMNLNISSVKIRKGKKKIPLYKRGPKRRNKSLVDLVDKFHEEVASGQYDKLSFLNYCMSKN